MVDRQLIGYFLKAFVLYLIWYTVYELWLKPANTLDPWLNEIVAGNGQSILVWLGYDSCRTGTAVCINGLSTVNVGNGCNGLEIYSIFAGFILIYEGKWYYKIPYIIVGIGIIYVCNVIRVVLLSIDHLNDMHVFKFNHKYTYVFMIYGIVFGLWVLWVSKFAPRNETT